MTLIGRPPAREVRGSVSADAVESTWPGVFESASRAATHPSFCGVFRSGDRHSFRSNSCVHCGVHLPGARCETQDRNQANGEANPQFVQLRIGLFQGAEGLESGGSARESNPPTPLLTRHNGFEDRKGHRAPSTPLFRTHRILTVPLPFCHSLCRSRRTHSL